MIFKPANVSVLILFLVGAFYLALPNYEFPAPPPGSVQSEEPGDSEDLAHLRAYFTNYNREETINYYKKQLTKSLKFGIPLPTYRLNYPPEEAQTIIHDQARSTFLEEIVHPLRESLYVNGFEPRVAKDEVWYKGIHYRQKITVRYAPSNVLAREAVLVLAFLVSWFLVREWSKNLPWISQ